jgi:adenine nucleotide transporter 17
LERKWTVANEFTGYEWTRAFFENAALKSGRVTKKLTTAESMMAGAVAGSLTVLITNPIWVVNTRMTTMSSSSSKEPILPTSSKLSSTEQPAPKAKPSTIAVALQILREEGLSGLFAGVMPALVLVINPILQYTVFEQLKNTLEKRRRVTPKDSFYLGALGKLAATSITYPYITVKSRMHVAKAKDGQTKKEGMGATLKRIVDEEGIKGLYGGEF